MSTLGIVEVAGIEPASARAAMGLLRAQPIENCRGWGSIGDRPFP